MAKRGVLTTSDYLPIDAFEKLLEGLHRDKKYVWELFAALHSPRHSGYPMYGQPDGWTYWGKMTFSRPKKDKENPAHIRGHNGT